MVWTTLNEACCRRNIVKAEEASFQSVGWGVTSRALWLSFLPVPEWPCRIIRRADDACLLLFTPYLTRPAWGQPPRQPAYPIARPKPVAWQSFQAVYQIAAPTSTKDRDREKSHDPEIHACNTGSQWHFSIKVHIAVDTQLGPVRSVRATAAIFSDISEGNTLH